MPTRRNLAGGTATAQFGGAFERSPESGDPKRAFVGTVFDRVARRYDLMNDLMSGGIHRLWKDAFVTALGPPRHAARRYLDLAGGTGDIAFRILDRAERAEVTVADINGEMLAVGKERAAARGLSKRLSFLEANAEDLPLQSNSFDAATIAFGIRNVTRIDRALAEARRVLKPGGRFLALEFSSVNVAWLDTLHDLYSRRVVPAIGRAVVGDAEPYEYLVESIRRFPNQARFAAMLRDAGLARVTWQDMSGGIVAIHSGWKL